jgi:hypothetical protein
VRRLDLDDVGPGLRHQKRRIWPLKYLAKIKDDDAGEREVGTLLPTRRELFRTALLATTTGAALSTVLGLIFLR